MDFSSGTQFHPSVSAALYDQRLSQGHFGLQRPYGNLDSQELLFGQLCKGSGSLEFVAIIKKHVGFGNCQRSIEIVTCSIAAYGMARFEFRGKKLLMFSMILTILVPEQLTAIPTLLNFRQLDFLGILRLIGMALGTELRPNILDTPLTFYLPSLFAVGLRGGLLIFIYMQFFKGLHKELEEAAWIDGAGPIVPL